MSLNSEAQDLFDLDIDFETAYNMLGNTDTFLSSFLNASPKKTEHIEPSNQHTSALFETTHMAQTSINSANTQGMQPQIQTQQFGQSLNNVSTSESNVHDGLNSKTFFSSKSQDTSDNDVSAPHHANLASFPSDIAQYNDHGNGNYIPETSNPDQRQRQPSTYELLSVNESHAIESFLDSLMEGNNQKNIAVAQQHVQRNSDPSHNSSSERLATPGDTHLKHEGSTQPFSSENIEARNVWGMEPQRFVNNVEHDASVSVKNTGPASTPKFSSPQPENDAFLTSMENSKEEENTDKLGYQELSVKYEKIMGQINVQKKKHLLAEQKRRAAIKNSFELLQNTIKYPRVDGFHARNSKKRVKKHEYLQFVIEDIEGLLRANQELREMNESIGNLSTYGSQQ